MTADYPCYLLSIGVPLAVLAQATDLLAGHCGKIGVSAVLFAAIGGYSYSVLAVNFGFNPWIAVTLSVAIVYLANRLFRFTLLYSGTDRYLLSSVALLLTAGEIANNCGLTGGAYGIRNIPYPAYPFWRLSPNIGSLVWSVPLLAASTILVGRLIRPNSSSRTSMHWIRDDITSARAFAVSANGVLSQALSVHSFLSGLAGIAIVTSQAYVSPEVFGLQLALQVLTIVYIGGTGASAMSMILGAAVLIVLGEAARSLNLRVDLIGPIEQIFTNAALILLLIFWRRGLMGPRIEVGPSSARFE